MNEIIFPKNIMQYWDQGCFPEDIESLASTWAFENKSFDYNIFNRDSARDFIFSEFGSSDLKVFDMAAIPAMRSDIFRVAYIVKKGGFYVDAATKCLKPITFPLISTSNLVLMRKWHGGVWNGFISAKPMDSNLINLYDNILNNVKNKVSNDVWSVTGPKVFNDLFKEKEVENVLILEQKKINEWFSLVNDLQHKKNDHWSSVQKEKSIYT